MRWSLLWSRIRYWCMANLAWDIIHITAKMPDSGGTVNGEQFAVPMLASMLNLHVPALVAAATVKLQSLDPGDMTTWRDVKAFNLSAGTTIALSAIPGGQVTAIPITATGGGMLRLVASSDQSSAPITITVVFTRGSR